MLPTNTEMIWTHKVVVDYSQLLSLVPDLTLNENITAVFGSGSYDIGVPTPIQLAGMTATVVSGPGITETGLVSAYTPSTAPIQFHAEFSPTPLTTASVIQFQRYNSYKDIMLFGIPQNAMILGVKVVVLTNFVVGTGNSLFVYVTQSNNLPTPVNNGDSLIGNVHNTYGMGNLTIPAGSDDSYEYGSFRWFSLSAPGEATYSRNNLTGNPTAGSYCIPQRSDAHDITARFCILNFPSGSDNPGTPTFSTNSMNSNLTVGDVEITVQYTLI